MRPHDDKRAEPCGALLGGRDGAGRAAQHHGARCGSFRLDEQCQTCFGREPRVPLRYRE